MTRASPPVPALAGVSVAGIETAIEVPSLRLVFDMGRCSRTAVNHECVAVSHGHLDHAGALAQHAARRAMLGMSEGVYLVPVAIAEAVERLFNAASALDGYNIPRRIVPLEPGQDFPLRGGRFLRPFATFHRVPSQGYVVWERRHRLLPEFLGRPGPDLGALRARGVVIEETHDVPLLAFTGDTRVDVLDTEPVLHHAQTLILETSFLDERVSVEEARQMGHVHLAEVLERRALLQNHDLVFSHFSSRYTAEEIGDVVRRLPDDLAGRVRALF